MVISFAFSFHFSNFVPDLSYIRALLKVIIHICPPNIPKEMWMKKQMADYRRQIRIIRHKDTDINLNIPQNKNGY